VVLSWSSGISVGEMKNLGLLNVSDFEEEESVSEMVMGLLEVGLGELLNS
jgi:hypothetical protein